MARLGGETDTGSGTNATRRALLHRLGGGGLATALALGTAPAVWAAQEVFDEDVALQRATDFLRLMNSGDLEALRQFIAPDCAFHWPWPVPGIGPDYAIGAVAAARSVIPDLVATPNEFQVAGNWVTVVATLAGTHTGAFVGITPMGRALSVQALFLGRVDENLQIAELWMQADVVAAGIQLAGAGELAAALLGGAEVPAATPTEPAPTPIGEMLSVPGVLLALDYGPGGKIRDLRSHLELPQAELEQAAALAPLLMAALGLAAERYSEVSTLSWAPVRWALYSAGEKWTIAFASNRFVIADTTQVDFDALYAALVGPRSA